MTILILIESLICH